MSDFRTISDIVGNGMCVGCGTCSGICPQKAIRMVKSDRHGHYVPALKGNCNKCFTCLEVCPAVDRIIKYSRINFKKEIGLSSQLGKYLECYKGHAESNQIRYVGSSGGLIPALLVHLFNEGVIDGVLTVRSNKENLLEPEPVIARSLAEIMKSTGSKYCPVSSNEALQYVLANPGKYAVVGRPCQIQGIRKAQEKVSKIKSRVILTLGLFCNHTPSFLATEYLIQQMGLKNKDIIELKYRYGWENCALVHLRDGSIKKLQMYWHLGFGSFFCPISCSICEDHTAELADISFGDAWLPEINRNCLGESIAIVRTSQGESILSYAIAKGVISLQPIKFDKVLESQRESILQKKKWVYGRIFLASRLGIIRIKFSGWVGLSQLIRAGIFLIRQKLGKSQMLWKVISAYYLSASYFYKRILAPLFLSKKD